MAAASSDSTGGYDMEFIDDVQKDLECPICLHPLKEPMQTPCGHLFCASCLDRQSRSGQLTCPLDKRQFPETAAFPDEWHKRKVLCLKVKCSKSKAGCMWNGQLRELDDHLKKCEYGRVSCEYESMGCEDQILPQEMDKHIKDNVSRHMRLLRNRIEHLEKENARLRAERWTKSHSCTFFWRVQNWRLKMEQASKGDTINIYSEPFYSDIPGQKLRMELFPNGDERSKGRHLSVFLRILKGDYDSVARWPFAKQCKVTIMSQQSDTRDNDVSRSVNLAQASQTLKDKALQRPESEEQKRSFGFSNFILLEDLKSGSFLLDDCLLIKAVVSTPST